ncbi:MAG: hypothetical protein QOJ07_1413, partial [Thermoleophilaceae bacterium]|nr:hypothetical protein [Thermoleophilaceae bacterium]
MPSLRKRSLARTAGLALALLLVGAAPASADFSLSGLSAAPTDDHAGAHSDFRVMFSVGGSDSIKDLDLALPPGLVGNPKAAEPRCSQAQFAADTCPAESVVGSTSVDTTATLLVVPVPITVTGTVYNLEPMNDEPARLGIILQPAGGLIGTIKLQSSVRLRTTGDYGLTSTLRDLPQDFNGIPIKIDAIDLTLNGTAATGPFMTNPTSCVPADTVARATSYEGGSAAAESAFTPTDCEHVPFTPAVAVTPATTQVDTPSAYSIAVNVPDEGAGRAQSHVKRVGIVLPRGTALNAPLGDGLATCSAGEFGAGSNDAPACAEASKVGTASIDTPLLGVLSGDVFLATPTAGDPFGLLVSIPLPGGRIKLTGTVTPDPATGQLTSVFEDLPQVPFTNFTLSFKGGDRGVLVNDVACGPQRTEALISPWSGGDAAAPSSQFDTSADGAGAPCGDPPPFAPTLTADSDNHTAGASPKLRMDVARAPGQGLLKDLQISLPAGLVGGIQGVGLCTGDAAKTGDCPAESLVGHATTIAGAGGAPLRLSGNIYLSTGDGGAPASLLAVVPARVGPYDFGNVVVKSNIRVRPGDGGFEVSAADLPQILGGIPLRLRGLSLSLDRDNFMRNPTNCGTATIAASFTSTAGAASSANAPYEVTGCDALAFGPKLSASAGGKGGTGRFKFPGVTTVVTQAPGEAAARSVGVGLPPQISANTAGLGTQCTADQLAAGSCPAGSKVGEAEAFTPLLPLPLTGPVYLTANPTGLPKLTVDLTGLLSLRLTGDVAPVGKSLVTTFAAVPDVPLSRFVLRFPGGKKGLLQNNADLCAAKSPTLTGTFAGHNGATSSTKAPLQVEGCPPVATVAVRALATGRPSVRLAVRRQANGKQLSQIRLRLPSGFTFDKRKLATGAKVTVGTQRVATKRLTLHGARELRIAALPGTNVDAVRIALSRGAVRASASLRKKARRRP